MSATVIPFRPKVRRIPIREERPLSFAAAAQLIAVLTVVTWAVPIAVAFWLGLL